VPELNADDDDDKDTHPYQERTTSAAVSTHRPQYMFITFTNCSPVSGSKASYLKRVTEAVDCGMWAGSILDWEDQK
jgi:hypothetical protein